MSRSTARLDQKGQREGEMKGGCRAPIPLNSSGRKQVEGSATCYEEGKVTQSKTERRGRAESHGTIIPRPGLQRFAKLLRIGAVFPSVSCHTEWERL